MTETAKAKSCKLYDHKTRLVATVEVPMDEPYFPGQSWALPTCHTHKGRHFRKCGDDRYAEEPRDVQLVNLDGSTVITSLFHPLPGAIVKSGHVYLMMNEDHYKEVPVLNLDSKE